MLDRMSIPEDAPKPGRRRKPLDVNEIAKSIVDQATGEEPSVVAPEPNAEEPPKREKDPIAVELGRRGGKKGGKARAEKLSPEERSAIARKAAEQRWKPRGSEQDSM